MVISVAKAVKSQLKQAKVGLLSHTTAIQAPQRETKQNRVINLLIKALRERPNEAQFDLIEFPIQLDAALYPEVANIKLPEPIDDPLKLPNLLVLPDITAANILYKCFEFGMPQIKITSPILWRTPRKGEVGLLPRTTTPPQIVRSLDILAGLVDFRKNNKE
jgi:phosphotransacetylase